VTYVLDGEVAHHDTNGSGGVIREGDTQWMTAGAGILHDELPTERVWREGGPVHAVQLWVNLPSSLKLIRPRYQAITSNNLKLITTPDGGALVRIIAGSVERYDGPGDTRTPITYLHATLSPGAELTLPWNPGFSAIAYVLTGKGSAGVERRPVGPHHLAEFGPGHTVTLRADERQDEHAALDVLVLGGQPIRQPISRDRPGRPGHSSELRVKQRARPHHPATQITY
jgi:quercetin 2,3-dioxygenase